MSGRQYLFSNNYQGLVGFGFDRETDEATLTVYLQHLADDELMAVLRQRMSNEELTELFDLVSHLLRTHLNSEEYHRLFLKETPDGD